LSFLPAYSLSTARLQYRKGMDTPYPHGVSIP
jgi:hypothetical protein